MSNFKIGDTVTFVLKPTCMRNWKVERETKNCYVITKKFRGIVHTNYLPKKQILQVIK